MADNLETQLKNSSLNGDDPAKLSEAEIAKEKGNESFKNQRFVEAVDHYTEAIRLNPTEASYYGNRSFAYIKSEFYGSALQDANRSIELDPKYIKGYYRRASANLALGKFKQALKDYEYVTKVRPNDKDASLKFSECQKIVKRIAFEKAIAVDDVKRSLFDDIDINAMQVDTDYQGPNFEFTQDSHSITFEFAEKLIEHFKNQKILHKKYAYKILFEINKYLKSQPSLIDIKFEDKFTVCGDIHGQFYDLLNVFKINGMPSEKNPYLFNGDFVDRGSFSVEVIFTLFTFKLLYPNHFFLARGNHESITMNQMYGFEGEVKAKYTPQMFQLFCELFNWLPLAHCINSRVLVMHGGLFRKDNISLDDIRKVDRNRQPPEEGIMCELMWSDPQYSNGISESKRGVGCQFGPDVTKRFLDFNKLDYVIRSHEVKQEGYEIMHDGKCITVFSAPNYCDTMGNKGAFITMNSTDLKPKFTTYEAVEHPKIKPMAYANSLSMFGLA